MRAGAGRLRRRRAGRRGAGGRSASGAGARAAPREVGALLGVALIGLAACLALYLGLVGLLLLRGRRADARALAGFVPDCAVLFRRLLGDARLSRPPKLLLLALVAYLAMPIDLIPDFIRWPASSLTPSWWPSCCAACFGGRAQGWCASTGPGRRPPWR